MFRASGTSRPIKILSVSHTRDDHATLRRSLTGVPCQIVTTDTCREALQRLHRGDISIVVCESDLPDGTWRGLLTSLRKSSEEPILIVSSRCADEHLWGEVLNLGGFDVIAKPFKSQELRHVLQTACLGVAPRV